MNHKLLRRFTLLAAGFTLAINATVTTAQTTAFTYQGRLNSSGSPATGAYDFTLTLFNAATGGTVIGPSNVVSGLTVTNGLFTVTPDFGPQFNGLDRWLEIAVRTNGGGAFASLAPRQKLTPTPYALYAPQAGTATTAFSVTADAVSASGLQASSVTSAKIADGSIVAADVNTASFSNTFWKVNGNAGASPVNGAFLGTTDNLPLEFRVNGARALRLEPNTNGAPNVIGGSPANSVAASVEGATIAGGGLALFPNQITASYATIGGGTFNTVAGGWTTIGGGRDNNVAGGHSTVSGGRLNTIQTNADYATIGAGYQNTILNSTVGATIGGGVVNMIQTNNHYSTLGGGYQNTIQSDSTYSTISGGGVNTILTNAPRATVSGGLANTVGAQEGTVSGGAFNSALGFSSTVGGGGGNQAGGGWATIAGGRDNLATNADYATIPGGQLNSTTASYAFAAGRRAKANHTGAFVWADATVTGFASTAVNQFLIRAGGGVGINTASPGGAALAVNGLTTSTTARINGANNWGVSGGEGDFRVGNDSYRFKIGVANAGGGAGDIWMRAHGGIERVNLKAPGGTRILSNEAESAGVSLASGGTAWAVISDRNVKKDFASVDSVQILEKLAAMPITQWHYQWESADATPHIGPMAQDFKAAFYPGTDDKSITTQEADGVALAAIQGLNQKLEQKETEITKLKTKNQSLEARLERLEKILIQTTK